MGALSTPMITGDQQDPSPSRTHALEISSASNVYDRLLDMGSTAPSERQQTQVEVLGKLQILSHLGNPFSSQRIPYSVMRDMACDPILSFALFYQLVPMISASWNIESPDPQLAAAVDAAFRPTMSDRIIKYFLSRRYGCSPMVKQFKQGILPGTYRDPSGEDPEADVPIWDSQVPVILPKQLVALDPQNSIPRWDEFGRFAGFNYLPFAVPNADLVGTTAAGALNQFSNGWTIDPAHALWVVSDQSECFGSIYGQPQTKRAHRFWWSFWFRWALADRSFENKADPPKIVYFPTDSLSAIDSEDPSVLTGAGQQAAVRLRAVALALGAQARSGSTLAIPGDFIRGDDGKLSSERKWKIEHLQGGENFQALDSSFQSIAVLMLRAMFMPEQALTEGSAGGANSRSASTQFGDLYQESMQIVTEDYDAYFSEHEIKQWVIAHFPEKIDIPVRKKTHGLGGINPDMLTQVLTLVGQVRGNILPIDIYELLRREGFPMLTKAQQDSQLDKIAEIQQKLGPPEVAPTKVGSQGYNAGVMRTETGEMVYFRGPGRIELSEHPGFLDALPEIPPYQDPACRSAAVQLRKMMVARYEDQLSSIEKILADRATLKLAQDQTQPEPAQGGIAHDAAVAVAATVVAAWLADQTSGSEEDSDRFGAIIGKVVKSAGIVALKTARLDTSAYDADGARHSWLLTRVNSSLSSIDQTVRNEVTTYLTDKLQHTTDPAQVAADLREHFDETAQTHSDRVARAEIRDAYNFGTLMALRDAGVTQVQAHDADGGHDNETDSKCIQRNGKIFSVEEALAEEEHPNGTLYFTPLQTENLSVEIVAEMPEHLEAPAAYDDKSETLYVVEELAESASRFALTLGEQLRMR